MRRSVSKPGSGPLKKLKSSRLNWRAERTHLEVSSVSGVKTGVALTGTSEKIRYNSSREREGSGRGDGCVDVLDLLGFLFAFIR